MKHIIHTDNSEFFCKLMRTFLTEKGLESEHSDSGEKAIQAVNEGRVNCVITGTSLADMSGEELVKRLMVNKQTVSVIVVTSSDDEGRIKRLKALNVKAVIQKSGDWKGELNKILH